MASGMERYVGRTVEIINMDGSGLFTQRTIVPLAVRGDAAYAYCCRKRAPRLFKLDRILAVAPASGGRTTG